MKVKIFWFITILSISLLTYFGYIYSANHYLENIWLPDFSYSEEYKKVRGRKRNHYKNSLPLNEWIDSYYSETDEIPNIFNEGAPKKYLSSNKQFGEVYSKINAYGLYSGCLFTTDYKNSYRRFNTDECYTNYEHNKNKEINGWEHVNPQSILNKATYYPELAKADLHNLRPALLYQYNSPRSNHLFGSFEQQKYKYGVLFHVGISNKTNFIVCEPRDEVKGDIARITFYMHDIYHLTYDINYYRMLIKWSINDPVDEYEKYLDKLIKRVMGINNMYVVDQTLTPH